MNRRQIRLENARARTEARIIKLHPEAKGMTRKQIAKRYKEWLAIFQEELAKIPLE